MDPKKLEGVWYESFEEGDADRVVYRSTEYEFPRSRAPRPSLQFGTDGTVTFGGAGPADRHTEAPGQWKVRGKTLTLTGPGRRDVYLIESADKDSLVLRRKESANGDDP